MKVDFQIIHSFKPKKLKENLLSLLKKTVDESTTLSIQVEEKPKNIEDWSIFNWIEIKYNINSGDKYIAGFSLVREFNIEESDTKVEGSKELAEEEFGGLTEEFGQKLQSNRDIALVIKYNDEVMATQYQDYVKEIFELEMELREVISFIFLDTYKQDYYDLLKDTNVKIQSLSENNKPDENYFKSHFENEFFFLRFGDYKNIAKKKDLKQSDLIGMISNSDSYEDLKQKIQNRSICKEKYQGFLSKVEENLDLIENFRNCIAHNRSIPKSENYRMIDDYKKARDGLRESIANFWEEINEQRR